MVYWYIIIIYVYVTTVITETMTTTTMAIEKIRYYVFKIEILNKINKPQVECSVFFPCGKFNILLQLFIYFFIM